jgi:small subunit ribosomal protein S1
VVNTYNVGDDLEGAVTKVVTFGAFVEILDGVEGLVHISELAPHHVENPREVVAPGDEIKVKVLEIDSERRRLSLSVKRVEGQILSAHTGGLDLGEEEMEAEAGEAVAAAADEEAAADEIVATADDEAVADEAAAEEEVEISDDGPEEQEADAEVEVADEAAPAPEAEAPGAEEAPSED